MPTGSYETVIIGGGPAGLTAGLYLCRSRIRTVLLEKQLPGGQAVNSPLIENYPGFPEGIDGMELISLFKQQADNFGLDTKTFEAVTSVEVSNGVKILKTDKEEVKANAVIVATGRSPKKMGIPGEDEYMGKGISYCATCDGPLFKDKPVMVIGGGDSAVEEALHLTNFASKVIIVHRRDELRASGYLQERALSEPKLEILWNSEIREVRGNNTVEEAVIENNVTGETGRVPVSGIFFYVGNMPNSSFLSEMVELDKSGYIITDENLETSVPGIFAAGDVRSNPFKQVVIATGEGALTAMSAQRYLEKTGARAAYKGDAQ
ncbi:MAG: thioredoxin-disulfide reductase [Actinobacteria bacterium]|nr:thioredoxin-disulfide reductase [Actinomycetota bacterium]